MANEPLAIHCLHVEIFFCEPHRINLLLYNNSEERFENIFISIIRIISTNSSLLCKPKNAGFFIEEQINTVWQK